MGTVTINIDNEIENDFRNFVYKTYGKSKGTLGKAVAEALEKWLKEKKQENLAKEAIAIMENGFNMGKIKIKKRSELYERG